MNLKLVEWNIHKMTSHEAVKPFVIDTLVKTKADVICLVEYTTDTGIKNALEKDYWFAESNTSSGNQVFIAVKKDIAASGIKVQNRDEVKKCYNFLHIDFKLQDGKTLSVIGVRMLSPMNAEKQTPSLKKYLSTLKTPFLCAGDFNIRRMDKWFSGIPIEVIQSSSSSFLATSSIIYVNRDSHKVNDVGAVDHVLHSSSITVNSQYDWSFLSDDPIYPPINQIAPRTVWDIPAAYPDHALMISDVLL